jgi:hypothetical protein
VLHDISSCKIKARYRLKSFCFAAIITIAC